MNIGHMMMAPIFVLGGFGAMKEPGGRIGLTKDLMDKTGITVDEQQAELMVKANGAAMIGAGAALGLGIFPRAAALALIGSLIPTTVAGHAFWEEEGAARDRQRIQFFKNLAIVGGLAAVALGKRK
ncbi:DoxX family protein [Trueperella abortisuis]|uniref:Membrane protein YphA (DoxX/SURF4 family) n=1 Tax=Trueperella abortisuis TaxID=445930 RepID=A0ABT9PFW7_9ACTO|nr:DoxX family protein [Trueperella abortisuis]MDP9831607.1 putative membrane protein YphA (DoxX/SURF4 family) [Trueperella abortisuis]